MGGTCSGAPGMVAVEAPRYRARCNGRDPATPGGDPAGPPDPADRALGCRRDRRARSARAGAARAPAGGDGPVARRAVVPTPRATVGERRPSATPVTRPSASHAVRIARRVARSRAHRRCPAGRRSADLDHPATPRSGDPAGAPDPAGPAPRPLRDPGHLGRHRPARRLDVARGQRHGRRRRGKSAVTRSTSFAIASVSKTFTAALIMALAEEGRLDLDAPVRRYLPARQEGLDEGEGPPAARPHERPARLLLPSVDRPPAARPARRAPGITAQAMRYVGKAVLRSGQGLALLEHQLPRARHARRGRRQGAARRPGARPDSSRPLGPRPDVVPAARNGVEGRRPRLSLRVGRRARRRRSTCPTAPRGSRSPRS